MKKRFTITLALAAAAYLLSAWPAAAQGRGSGHDAGAGAAGTHEPMGMGSAMDSHGAANGANNSTPGGQKTPDELLAPKTKLSQNLAKLLPTNLTPQQACANFRNLGQCVAAIHVAKNLGIDFNSLACNMTLKPVGSGTCTNASTTGKGMSLGASIQALDPSLTQSQVKSETKTAQHQAQNDLSAS